MLSPDRPTPHCTTENTHIHCWPRDTQCHTHRGIHSSNSGYQNRGTHRPQLTEAPSRTETDTRRHNYATASSSCGKSPCGYSQFPEGSTHGPGGSLSHSDSVSHRPTPCGYPQPHTQRRHHTGSSWDTPEPPCTVPRSPCLNRRCCATADWVTPASQPQCCQL